MPRLALKLLFILSLLLCLILLYCWPRSYFPKKSHLETHAGRLYIVFWEGSLPRDGVGFETQDPADSKWYYGVDQLWDLLQFANPSSEMRKLGFASIWGAHNGMRYHILAIPFWFLLILLLAILIPSFLLLRRHRLRAKLGHCLSCGYDLHESKDKCPECGTAIPAPT